MMTTVTLGGELGKRFGRKWRFDIHSPAQAVNALEAARPGFRAAILQMRRHAFRVKVGDRYITGKYLRLKNHGKTVSITPILESAASGKAIGEIIAGVVLIAAGIVSEVYAFGNPYGAQAILLGIGLTLGGIASILAPTPTNTRGTRSKIFGGAANTADQGGPVNIAYGRVMCGSEVLSVDMTAKDVKVGSKIPENSGNNTGTSAVPASPNSPAVPAYANNATVT